MKLRRQAWIRENIEQIPNPLCSDDLPASLGSDREFFRVELFGELDQDRYDIRKMTSTVNVLN